MAGSKPKRLKHEVSDVVAEYRGKLPLYEEFTTTCRELVERLLHTEGIRVHSITCRAKSCESLAGKLGRGEKQYEALGQVTDLAGIRVVTYFADDVDAVATMIEREFAVVPEDSIDKRKALDPDRFGYLSLHYVCTLTGERARLTEYAVYKDCVCEIQVRSILQHAWAEIEHDLGYKAVQGIPKPMRRRFSRLAGLLEIADDEFMRLRDELAAYAVEVKKDIAEKPSGVLLDKVSLAAFIEQDDTVRRVDQTIAERVGAKLEKAREFWAEFLLEPLRSVGMNTIQDVLTALTARQAVVVREFRYLVKEDRIDVLQKGVCLAVLWPVLLAETGDPAAIVAAFERFSVVLREGTVQEYASGVVQRMKDASAERRDGSLESA